MVSDCPDPCPQNRHCDDSTHGLCECIPGHESDPSDPTGACCPGENSFFTLTLGNLTFNIFRLKLIYFLCNDLLTFNKNVEYVEDYFNLDVFNMLQHI